MDGEILISLDEKHTPTATHMADLRRELPKRFPELQFFFQPADIVNQVLNFGQPAPIDIRVSGPNNDKAFALATQLAHEISGVPGVVDSHVFQVPNAPSLGVDVDRTLAQEVGLSQQNAATNLLVSLNNSAQIAPNFWVNPNNSVSYPLVVQEPTYRIDNLQDLKDMPLASDSGQQSQLLMNIAKFDRGQIPMVISQLNIRPVFDVNADVQGRDMKSASDAIQSVIDKERLMRRRRSRSPLPGRRKRCERAFPAYFRVWGLRSFWCIY